MARSFNLSFPVGGAVHTPDMRIKFGQIEHSSGVSAGRGMVLFPLFPCNPTRCSWLHKSHAWCSFKSPHMWIQGRYALVNVMRFGEQKPSLVLSRGYENKKRLTDWAPAQCLFYWADNWALSCNSITDPSSPVVTQPALPFLLIHLWQLQIKLHT